MKVQFKYAFKTGLPLRGAAFGVTAGMMVVFIALGMLDLAPLAAMITAVSLGGVGIAAMLVINIISDVAIIRRLYNAPEAYLYALTPMHRGKAMLASVLTMALLDIVTMAVVIIGEVWLSLMLAGNDTIGTVMGALNLGLSARGLLGIFEAAAVLIAGYIFVVMVILFAVTVSRSVLYQKKASGILTFLIACGCFYAFSLLQLVIAPFGTIERYGFMLMIAVADIFAAVPVYIVLLLACSAALFAGAARLMENKLNI